jgi:MoxR-like ATPase
VATQNPHQFHGTYPLPEGQLNRFMVATTMGYPDRRAELGIVRAQVEGQPLEEMVPVVDVAEVAHARDLVRHVQVHEEVFGYAVSLAEATREHPAVSLGVSPRGSIALIRAAQAPVATRERDFVGPGDVKELAPDTLVHRISARGASSGATAEAVVAEEVLKFVPAPA